MEIECVAPVEFHVPGDGPEATKLLENKLILKKEYGNARLVSGDGMIWLLGAQLEHRQSSSKATTPLTSAQPADQANAVHGHQHAAAPTQQKQQQPLQVREIKITSLRNSSFRFRVAASDQVTRFLSELQQQIAGKHDLAIKKKKRKIRKKMEQDLAVGFQPVNTLKSPVKLPTTTPPRSHKRLSATSPVLFSPKQRGESMGIAATSSSSSRFQSPMKLTAANSPFRSPFRKKRNVNTTPTRSPPVLLPSLDEADADTAIETARSTTPRGAVASKTPSPAITELSSTIKRKEWLSPLREQKKRVGLPTPTRIPLQHIPVDPTKASQTPHSTPINNHKTKANNANGIATNATGGRSLKSVRSLQFELEQIPGPTESSVATPKQLSEANKDADNTKPFNNYEQTPVNAIDKENDSSSINRIEETTPGAAAPVPAPAPSVMPAQDLSPSKVHGLLNLGNFCYMNAIIQALASLGDFVHALEDEDIYLASLQRHLLSDPATSTKATGSNNNNNKQRKLITVTTPPKHAKSSKTHRPTDTAALAKVWTDFKAKEGSQRVVQTSLTRILQLVTNGSDRFINPDFLKRVMGSKNALFAGAMQQDAHEFLLNLLNEVEMEMLHNAQTVAKSVMAQKHQQEHHHKQEEHAHPPQQAQASLLNFFTPASTKKTSSPSPQSVDETERATTCGKDQSKTEQAIAMDPTQLFVGELPPAHFFRTQLERRLTCCSCGFARKTMEMFYDFSLDFSPRQKPSRPLQHQHQQQLRLQDQQQSIQQVPSCLCGKPAVLYPHENPSMAYYMCNDRKCALRVSLEQFQQRVEATTGKPTSPPDTTVASVATAIEDSNTPSVHGPTPMGNHHSLRTDAVRLEALLQRHFEPTRFELNCEKCSDGREVFCDYKVHSLPNVLVFHLKRFELDLQSPDLLYKRCDRVQAPVRLEPLSAMAGNASSSSSPVYQLRSVVHHLGRSVDQGHYMTDVCVQKSRNERSWKRYNDTFVSEISEDQAVGPKCQESCYMLFYVLEQALPSDAPKPMVTAPSLRAAL